MLALSRTVAVLSQLFQDNTRTSFYATRPLALAQQAAANDTHKARPHRCSRCNTLSRWS